MIAAVIGLFLRRIANTWAFMWQSLGVIRAYRPLTFLPIASGVFCVLVSITVLGGGAFVFNIPIRGVHFAPSVPRLSVQAMRQLTLAAVDGLLGGDPGIGERTAPRTEAERKAAEHVRLLLLFFYLANYCVITYFNVALAQIALDRLGGGKATLDDGLRIAWARKFSILQWAICAATVGMLLKMVRDRSEIGKWIASFLGYFWNLGRFFVMPLLALESISPGEALYCSAALIKERWGEFVIAGFSFPLLFFVLSIPGLALFFLAGLLGQALGLAAVLAIAYWLLLAVIVSSTEQVFTAVLFLYAKEDKIAQGFYKIDLKTAWEGLPELPKGQAL